MEGEHEFVEEYVDDLDEDFEDEAAPFETQGKLKSRKRMTCLEVMVTMRVMKWHLGSFEGPNPRWK